MRFPFRLLVLAVALLTGEYLPASEIIPPVPAKYFNDYTSTVSSTTAGTLNRQLEQFERDSSNQLLVVVYPKMESDSSLEDYTVRVAQSWRAGQKEKNNGAVLFVFKNDRKLRIEVGYGLEPTLTDAACHSIIENILKPRFRQGNFDQGLSEAISAMIAATKGEYRGTGRTVAEAGGNILKKIPPQAYVIFVIFVIIVIANAYSPERHSTIFSNPNRRSSIWWDSSSSSSSSSDSGGFSSGGGSFGGGGSSGSW